MMGLDISHDAFSGSYGSFNRLRQTVAKTMGGSFPPHDNPSLDHDQWYVGDGVSEAAFPGLWAFLKHSDCDGEIDAKTCACLAIELHRLLPSIDNFGTGSGHIQRDGGYGGVARQLIAGCNAAYAANEPLVFE